MTRAEYVKSREGAVVRTRREMTSRVVMIPAGTVMTVTHKHNGFELRGAACSCCGVAPFITKVPWGDVDLVSAS